MHVIVNDRPGPRRPRSLQRPALGASHAPQPFLPAVEASTSIYGQRIATGSPPQSLAVPACLLASEVFHVKAAPPRWIPVRQRPAHSVRRPTGR